ncbi:hypothetical protein TR51_10365 [Kitasatospora griseola]|uniref:Uncharacterized protein n=1 Tax=Kitasatospora griseola TaxID=2064 RepID=A0A0D0N8S8_KITGR|nr:hypothetical protein TR51_10365 [Kitasatospora griseola]
MAATAMPCVAPWVSRTWTAVDVGVALAPRPQRRGQCLPVRLLHGFLRRVFAGDDGGAAACGVDSEQGCGPPAGGVEGELQGAVVPLSEADADGDGAGLRGRGLRSGWLLVRADQDHGPLGLGDGVQGE